MLMNYMRNTRKLLKKYLKILDKWRRNMKNKLKILSMS